MIKPHIVDHYIGHAVKRAARDRGASIAVYLDGHDVVVRSLPAAPPKGVLSPHCVAQFWSENESGDVTVQVRYPGAESEFRQLLHWELKDA